MLLRRITQHVRSQNWFAVFLDFIIVVVGVFIGIQVANWNEARIERRLVDHYIISLAADLQSDLAFSLALTTYYEEVFDNVLKADQLLSQVNVNDTIEFDSKNIVITLYRASEIAYRSPRVSTWEQIVSSGHLGLLPQAVIDSGLSEYYTDNESDQASYVALTASDYRKWVRFIIPLPVQIEIRKGCSDIYNDLGYVMGFAQSCQLSIEQEILDETATTLLKDQEIRKFLRFQYSMLSTLLNNLKGNNVSIKRSLNALAAIRGES